MQKFLLILSCLTIVLLTIALSLTKDFDYTESKDPQQNNKVDSLVSIYDSISQEMRDILSFLDSIKIDTEFENLEKDLQIHASLQSDLSFLLKKELDRMHPHLDSMCIPYFNYEIYDSWDDIDSFLDSLLHVRQQDLNNLTMSNKLDLERTEVLTFWINRIKNDIEFIQNHPCQN